MFYEQDSSFYDNGINDKWWVNQPGAGMTTKETQGTAQDGDFKTNVFDVVRSQDSIRWGTLATFGLESEGHERERDRVGPRVDADPVRAADPGRELALERLDLRAEHHDAGVEHAVPGRVELGAQRRDRRPVIEKAHAHESSRSRW